MDNTFQQDYRDLCDRYIKEGNIMKQEVQNQPTRRGNPYMGALVAILVILFLNGLIVPGLTDRTIVPIDYGSFLSKVEEGQVRNVVIKNDQIYFTADEEGKQVNYQTGLIEDPQLVDRLLEAKSPNEGGKIAFNRIVPQENSPLLNFFLLWVLPGLIFYLIWRHTNRLIQSRMGSGGNFMSFGNSGAKIYADAEVTTTFQDVAGQEEAKEALREIVDFLHNPTRYTEIGASLPKGALLVGPPGTGKTLIARAVAGEAKVPFFAISGSEFVQMFVGMGAAKVRDLFRQANEKAPCIIFIDEIDAIGKRRESGMGANDEREQTLNQLLTEMDHLKKVRHRAIDLDLVARATAGSSGAELANIVNEAALLAVRQGRHEVVTSDLEESVETVIAGAQKKGKVLSAGEKRIVSYHEIGHALVAAAQSHSAPVHKITIVPRTSGALGYTMQVDSGEQVLLSREDLFNRIVTLTGGRAAEEVIIGTVSTGASNDIEQATRLARAMVTRYGMSDKYDMMMLETVNNAYLGGDTSLACSSETAAEVDREVLSVIREAHQKAKEIISGNLEIMHDAASYLLEKETITGDEFMAIVHKHQ